MTGFLAVSATLTVSLTSAGIANDRKNKTVIHNQKLDTNDDHEISLNGLPTRQDPRFAKLDQDENGMIEKHGLDARLITKFHHMDREGGGLLRGEQLPGYHHCGRKY